VTRRRLDAELVRRGLAPSRTAARELVEGGRVLVGGAPADKPARLVAPGDAVVLVGEPPRFVGRGGQKLLAALEGFGIDPDGDEVLDAGASTGGFTDCLLQHGATRVVALDVGHGQLHERLRSHPAVVVVERTNLRHADLAELGAPFDGVVADLSFISLTAVADQLLGACRPGGWLVVLVKPQFEVGRIQASRGRGVISDPGLWASSVEAVADAVRAAGGSIMGVMASPLRGADGNVEFLLHARRERGTGPPHPGRPLDAAALAASLERVVAGIVAGPDAPGAAEPADGPA
jgi:23S rRNA (cytidine1920-2'-O)/16S rRNA (cytidine1409-2'-O)-methyltransferase